MTTQPHRARLCGPCARALQVVLLSTVAACAGRTTEQRRCTLGRSETGCATTLKLQTALRLADPDACAHVGICGPYAVWQGPTAFDGQTCVYEPTTQHLISWNSCSDVPLYCEHSDYCAWGGQQIDARNLCDLAALPTVCANGQPFDGPNPN